jgi:hypothetical protein
LGILSIVAHYNFALPWAFTSRHGIISVSACLHDSLHNAGCFVQD